MTKNELRALRTRLDRLLRLATARGDLLAQTVLRAEIRKLDRYEFMTFENF